MNEEVQWCEVGRSVPLLQLASPPPAPHMPKHSSLQTHVFRFPIMSNLTARPLQEPQQPSQHFLASLPEKAEEEVKFGIRRQKLFARRSINLDIPSFPPACRLK
jgi:hypothetical protein